jgi:hypothetical protein
VPRVARREENTVEGGVFDHRALVPANYSRWTIAAILLLLVRPMALAIVVSYPFSVELLHFLPTRSLMKMKVCHFPDDVDYVQLTWTAQFSPLKLLMVTNFASSVNARKPP